MIAVSNHSAQPRPGERFGADPEPAARPGLASPLGPEAMLSRSISGSFCSRERALTTALLVSLALLGGLCAGTAGRIAIRDEVVRLTIEIPYVDISAVLYDRSDPLAARFRTDDEYVFQSVLVKLRDQHFDRDDMLALLKDPSPKVRTLAAVALFERGDPSVLPALASLAGDTAKTFDTPGQVDPIGRLLPPEQQTVGDLARRMVEFYMERAGYFYGAQRQFQHYWAARSNRRYCTSWFEVQVLRASQGTTPIPLNRRDDVRRVRTRIDALPGDDRYWVLLALRGCGNGALVTDSELLECCRHLGPDKLVKMLQRNIGSTDPDLQPTLNDHVNPWVNTTERHRSMSAFILGRAADLLRSTDTQTLRDCQLWEQDWRLHEVSNPVDTRLWAEAISALEAVQKGSRED